MKQFLTIAAVFLLALALLTACGKTSPAEEAAPAGETESSADADVTADYAILVSDADGNPVDGCTLTVCTGNLCFSGVTENGEYAFRAAPCAYSVHVVKVPEGYAVPMEEYLTPEAGGTLEIVLEREP